MAKIVGITRMIAVSLTLIFVSTRLLADPGIAPVPACSGPVFRFATTQKWLYFRQGLNYLESPQPLAPPESVLPAYIHPDSKGFGAYGLSPEAYSDVQRLYPFFRAYSWQDVLNSQTLYDMANQAFADWLLSNLQECLPLDATDSQTFEVLHQVWNLGLTGYKKGRRVVSSRERRAAEFLSQNI
jgi:hypothetical protein